MVVDDHPMMRLALKRVLGDVADIEVVAEAADGIEALAQAEACHPDVIIMDAVMAKMDGVEATRRLHERSPDIAVLGLTFDDGKCDELLAAGAKTCVLKNELTPERLGSAIREAAAAIHRP
jgi:DNA-binding NarL/FixJ family response regulator